MIPVGTKGMPLAAGNLTLDALARSGWNVLQGDFSMPLMVLKESALQSNIEAMAHYCADHGVELCPHGKTTMAPQLFRRQLAAGAWGMTAATPAHLRTYRHHGVDRIIYANQLVELAVIEWVARELERDPDFEFACLVDSGQAVAVLDGHLASAGATRPVAVLLEVGFGGGRCGVRDLEAALRVAAEVDATENLRLWGVECFEGLRGEGDETADADSLLAFVATVTEELMRSSSLAERDEVVISAGGSAFFDRVIKTFVDGWEGARPVRVILRSGCYVTHDGGFYRRTSPLDGRRDGPPLLHDAIEVWSAVLSRPEPELAICSMGKRDAPQDMGMPVPTKVLTREGELMALDGAEVVALSDQHGHIALDAGVHLGPGDLVACAVSHPCGAFDRWKVIPIVDDQYRTCDALATEF